MLIVNNSAQEFKHKKYQPTEFYKPSGYKPQPQDKIEKVDIVKFREPQPVGLSISPGIKEYKKEMLDDKQMGMLANLLETKPEISTEEQKAIELQFQQKVKFGGLQDFKQSKGFKKMDVKAQRQKVIQDSFKTEKSDTNMHMYQRQLDQINELKQKSRKQESKKEIGPQAVST